MFKKFISGLAICAFTVYPVLAQERTFVTNPPSTSGSGVTYNSGTNTITTTAADGARIYSTTRPIERGAKYTYEFTVSGHSAGRVAPYVGTTRDTYTAQTLNATVPATSSLTNAGLTPIADNFTTADGLIAGPAVSAGDNADPVGAFRFFCYSGQIQSADPLVVPNMPGASHMHNFFGNTGANAYSTYKSLRTAGGSTCGTDQANPVWRTGYWFPAMLNGRGGIVTAATINVYYKRAPVGSVDCSGIESGTGTCVRMPHGLTMIWGYNMATMQADPSVRWSCRARFGSEFTDGGDNTVPFRGPSYNSGSPTTEINFSHLQALRDAGACPANASIVISTPAPSCWDGTRVRSPDHRAHVKAATGSAGLFHGKCPSTHPYHFVDLSLQIYFDVDSNLNTWRLSSDDQMGMGVAAGETFHTDFMEAVSPAWKSDWETSCIDGRRSCSEGNNGTGLRIEATGQGVLRRSRIVPLSRQGLGRLRSANGTYRGEFTAPADGEFGLNFYLFTGNITGFKVTKITKGARGPVTQAVTQ